MSHNRDSMQSELTKTTLAKSKLETLCRELQKQNKSIQASVLEWDYVMVLEYFMNSIFRKKAARELMMRNKRGKMFLLNFKPQLMKWLENFMIIMSAIKS